MHITKSDYLLYKQCPKSLWLAKHRRNVLQSPRNPGLIEKGNEVTEAARGLFPGGILVPYSNQTSDMVQFTRDLIASGESVIYEAALEFDGLLVICDILQRSGETWWIHEVKAGTEVTERHADDAAYQFYVASHCLPVGGVTIMHINNQYVRDGSLELQQLFTFNDLTDSSAGSVARIAKEIEEIRDLLSGSIPEQAIGRHCLKYGKKKMECPAKSHCWSHIPEVSVFDLSRIGDKAFTLYENDIVSLEDISDEEKLSPSQRLQVEAHCHGLVVCETKPIRHFLTVFSLPLYFLDFETFQQSIPRFNKLKPFQQIPFQYSLHIVTDESQEPVHREFLGTEGEDPREQLIKRLIADIPKGARTVAYNMSFEKSRLKELSEFLPQYAERLMDIHDNMVDLMIPFQKKWFYNHAMRGSYSIKYVLPAVLGEDEELDYGKLNIRDGSMAMEQYERLHTYPKKEIERIREDLLAYCRLDTLAMVRIWQFLRSL